MVKATIIVIREVRLGTRAVQEEKQRSRKLEEVKRKENGKWGFATGTKALMNWTEWKWKL